MAGINYWTTGDPKALDLLSDDVVYVADILGGGTFHGREGVLKWFVQWRQELTDYELDVERVEDLGDQGKRHR